MIYTHNPHVVLSGFISSCKKRSNDRLCTIISTTKTAGGDRSGATGVGSLALKKKAAALSDYLPIDVLFNDGGTAAEVLIDVAEGQQLQE